MPSRTRNENHVLTRSSIVGELNGGYGSWPCENENLAIFLKD